MYCTYLFIIICILLCILFFFILLYMGLWLVSIIRISILWKALLYKRKHIIGAVVCQYANNTTEGTKDNVLWWSIRVKRYQLQVEFSIEMPLKTQLNHLIIRWWQPTKIKAHSSKSYGLRKSATIFPFYCANFFSFFVSP